MENEMQNVSAEKVEEVKAEQPKKSNVLKWIVLAIIGLLVAGLVAWCVYNAVEAKTVEKVFKFGSVAVLFILIFVICALGYLLGSITIKGVNLGTAGVFLVAILFGFLCTLNFGNVPVLGAFHVEHGDAVVDTMGGSIQNLGLIMFVVSVGLIAGPNFFKNLKKNFQTYILLGAVIIISSTLVGVLFTTIFSGYGSGFWSGILSGALTTTPGFSAAQEAVIAKYPELTVDAIRKLPEYTSISLGHAIAYPFGVIGVVLFVQLLPKFLKSDMAKERALLKIDGEEKARTYEGLFQVEPFGLVSIALAIVSGLALGAIKIPLFGGTSFSLGTTGGVLIMGLVLGHFGKIGKLSLEVPEHTSKLLREFGLMLFLLGAGFEGGVNLVSSLKGEGAGMVIWGFVGGATMTIVPMIIGFILAKFAMKLPLLNALGSITGGMTSTPALGTLISTAETEDVASAYASTYPIALVLVVLACNLIVGFL